MALKMVLELIGRITSVCSFIKAFRSSGRTRYSARVLKGKVINPCVLDEVHMVTYG